MTLFLSSEGRERREWGHFRKAWVVAYKDLIKPKHPCPLPFEPASQPKPKPKPKPNGSNFYPPSKKLKTTAPKGYRVKS